MNILYVIIILILNIESLYSLANFIDFIDNSYKMKSRMMPKFPIKILRIIAAVIVIWQITCLFDDLI